MVPLDWIWPDRFAYGKLGLIVGLPEEGKGLLFCYVAERITTGGAWPCGEGFAEVGNVLLFSAEDDIGDTFKPRLIAAGADVSRIHVVKMVCEGGKRRMFSLASDLEMLQRKIMSIGDIKAVLIDPVSAYLGVGKIDSYRTTDVRAVLGPLTDLAMELKTAVIGIMHFNKKTDVTNALLRVSDSLAFGATARHVYGIVSDPDNQRQLIVRAKNNLAERSSKALAFRFDSRDVGAVNGKVIRAPFIVFEPDYVDVTATEAMQAAAERKSPGARDKIAIFTAASYL
jgi:hypothetical protein